MYIKKSLAVGLVTSLMSIGQTGHGEGTSSAGNTDQAASCPEGREDEIINNDNPLYGCPSDLELHGEELKECRIIVACMVKLHMFVDPGVLAKFAGNTGSDTEETCPIPETCIPMP